MLGFATIVALLGGTLARIPPFYIHSKRIGVKTWKIIILTIILTFCELAGTMILFRIENGAFGGMSYFGGILLLPMFGVILSALFRIRYVDMMDIIATGTGGMLAIMRIQCLYYGCCMGAVIFSTNSGIDIRFPSRMAEILTVIVITVILLNMGKNKKCRGYLYPTYLLCYGVIRFIINWFRDGVEQFIWVLPAGNFWSLVAIAFGVFWIVLYKHLQQKRLGK